MQSFVLMHNFDLSCNPVSSSDNEVFSKNVGSAVLYFISMQSFDLSCNLFSTVDDEIFSKRSSSVV